MERIKTYTPAQFKRLYPEELSSIHQAIHGNEKRLQWLKQRRGHFTASEVWKLFTSKYKPADNETSRLYILEVAAEIFGAYKSELSSAAIRWGNDHEFEGFQYYERKYNTKLIDSGLDQKFLVWSERCGATPDALIGKTQTLQLKCPFNPGYHVRYLATPDQDAFKNSFPKIYIQIQTELLVTGRKLCWFASYDKRFDEGWKMKRIKINLDKEFQPVLIKRLQEVEKQVESFVESICKNGETAQ